MPSAEGLGRIADPRASIACRQLPPEAQTQLFDDVISYIVRRAICGLTIKNYNNVFLQLLKRLPSTGGTAEAFQEALSGQKSDASRWPSDDEFGRAWRQDSMHSRLGDVSRLRAILSELENSLRSPRAEEAFTPVAGTLDVDHILPDKWYAHWPLDGDTITSEEALRASQASLSITEPNPRRDAINRREKLKATIGNLTLVHYGINRSLQNGPFNQKRETLFAESNLHLNRPLIRAESWDEFAIEKRGKELFELARRIWCGPLQ